MNFSNPTVATIHISSPVADFQTEAGWVSEVNISLLPPYDNKPTGLILAINTALGSVGCRPLDNMADMEEAWRWVTNRFVVKQGELTKRLSDMLHANVPENTNYSVESVHELFTMRITLTEREDVFAALDKVDLSPITGEEESEADVTPPNVVSVIAAMSTTDQVIGVGADIPWDLPEEQQQFKADTLDHAIVMGRKTLDSIGRLLPGRLNIVVTRDPETRETLRAKYGTKLVILDSLERAIGHAQSLNLDTDIIGGGEVYRQAMDHADRLVLTFVNVPEPIVGEDLVYFPQINTDVFQVVNSTSYVSDTDVDYVRKVYHRVAKNVIA